MKVLLPSETTHTIYLIPRFYPSGVLSMVVVKEGVNTSETITPTYIVNGGIISLTFDLVGLEQSRFSVKILENDNVIYRDKLFFTEQTPQDFKLTKNTYVYV